MIARDKEESRRKYTLLLGSKTFHCHLFPGHLHSVGGSLYGTIFLLVNIRRCNVGQQIRPNIMDFKSPFVTLSRRNDRVCSGRSMRDAMVSINEMSLDQSYLT